MPTKKQLSNLKRGGAPATAEGARKARQAKQEHRDDEERLGRLARADPDAALVELWTDLAVGVKRLTRKWLDAGGNPSRELVNAWRECRLLTDRVAELLRETTSGADNFFRGLEKRLASGAVNLTPRPYIEAGEIDHAEA